ncbi:hypothetical protein B0H14DRAFT_2630575 [Mycena olivaceomarginata]|nr:hypothetical protein B0H14DRAFT_2630575 [Mycena olivaceomarginata]
MARWSWQDCHTLQVLLQDKERPGGDHSWTHQILPRVEFVVINNVISSITWLLEPERGNVQFRKYSGTLEHPRYSDKQGATINAFQHFVYINSDKSLVLADIQASESHNSAGKASVLFDLMSHTVTGNNGGGDHGVQNEVASGNNEKYVLVRIIAVFLPSRGRVLPMTHTPRRRNPQTEVRNQTSKIKINRDLPADHFFSTSYARIAYHRGPIRHDGGLRILDQHQAPQQQYGNQAYGSQQQQHHAQYRAEWDGQTNNNANADPYFPPPSPPTPSRPATGRAACPRLPIPIPIPRIPLLPLPRLRSARGLAPNAPITPPTALLWTDLEQWMDAEYARQVCALMRWDAGVHVPAPPGPDAPYNAADLAASYNSSGGGNNNNVFASNAYTGYSGGGAASGAVNANNAGYCVLTFSSVAAATAALAKGFRFIHLLMHVSVSGTPMTMPNSARTFVLGWAPQSALPPPSSSSNAGSAANANATNPASVSNTHQNANPNTNGPARRQR